MPSLSGSKFPAPLATKVALWAIPIVLLGVAAFFVYIGQVQPASFALINLRQILSNGGYWFIPAILIGLWLGVLIGAVRGVSLGIVVGLFSFGSCQLAFPSLFGAFTLSWLNPPVPMTLGGMIGGLIGGLLDRPRGTAAYWEDSWSVKLALAGAGVGFVVGFCAFTLLATRR